MTETSINYAKALYELSVPEEAVLETEKIFRGTPQLKGALENPLVSLKEKEHVIDRVFPQEMKNFLKVTCKYQKISSTNLTVDVPISIPNESIVSLLRYQP